MNQVALITGCSSGIGAALAKECLHQGWTVYAGVRRLDSLPLAEHPKLYPLQLDVNDAQAIQRCAAQIQQQQGRLDYLINNAGFAAMGPLMEMSDERLAQQFRTNVFAPIQLTQACLPLLRAANSASVINIGSVSGILTTPFSGAYCASKAALHSLSDALRLELKPFAINVITVQPGAIESGFGDNSLAGLDSIAEGSIYAPWLRHIEARAVASQQNPTAATEFAQQLLARLKQTPKAEIRLGNGSSALPAMKRWLPTAWRDRILAKRFGLNKK